MKRLLFSLIVTISLIPHLAADDSPLIALRDAFDSELGEIEKETERKITKLQDSYVKALERLAVTEQKKGDLDSLLAVREELERFKKEKTVLPEDTKGLTEELQGLLATYYEAEGKIQTAQQVKVAGVANGYVKNLNGLERQLTKAGKVDEALAVRKEKERGDELLSANPVASNTGGSTTTPTISSRDMAGNLASGLILFHEFNSIDGDKVMDSSDSQFHGTVKGAVWVKDGRESGNGAIQFSGAESGVDLGDVMNDLDFPITLSAWIKPVKFPTTWNPAVIYESDQRGLNHDGFALSVCKRRYVSSKLGDGKGGGPESRLGSVIEEVINPDQWLHVTVVWESGKKPATVYLNGKAREPKIEGEGTITTIVHSDKPATIGRLWNGMIDDVALWKRTLSEDEVLALYKQSK